MVQEAEDGGVGSDGEGEGEDSNGGKARIAPESANPVAQIAQQRFQEPGRALLEALLAGTLQSSEGDRGHIRLGLPLEVELQFLIHFETGFALEQKAEA